MSHVPASLPRALMLTPDVEFLDRRIAYEAGSLAGTGWAVDIYPTSDPTLIYDGDLGPGVRLLTAPAARRSASPQWTMLRSLKRRAAAEAAVVDVVVDTIRYRLRPPVARLTAANIDNCRALGRYSLVFAHDVPVGDLAAELAKAWHSPMICDLHEIFPEQDEFFRTETARRYWRIIERRAIKAADGVICVNDGVREYVRTTYRSAAPIGVVQNSVPFVADPRTAGPGIRDLYEIHPSQRILLFVGSLRAEKNLDTVVRGFGIAGLDGWSLAILGSGPSLDGLRALIDLQGLGGRVFVGARVGQRDLIAVSASADVGLLPYLDLGLNHRVATPNKLFEYIEARLPIAASRLPMIERMLVEHRNGGFVDFSTPTTTASGLRRFVGQDLPSITISDLEAAARDVSWERDERAFLTLVEEVLAGRARSTAGDGDQRTSAAAMAASPR